MKHSLNRREAAISIGLLAAGGFAQAQDKPAVRILVGFAPGGAADILALYGPPGMAPDLVTRVSSAVAETMKLPDAQERITALGQQASYASAADLATMQAAHFRRWEAPIKASGFTAD